MISLPSAHTACMKLTTWIASGILIFFGLCASVFALTGFNLFFFLCGSNPVVYRALLSLAGVAALWLFYWLVAFRPTKYVS